MFRVVLWIAFLLIGVFERVYCEEQGNFFLNAAKTVPRIGRNSNKNTNNNNNNADFEKFFLKASKSVPRIGRRNQNPMSSGYELQQPSNKISYPTWSEIADRFEYDPELFTSPELLARLEEEMGDDPSVYEWDKVRIKRAVPPRFMYLAKNHNYM